MPDAESSDDEAVEDAEHEPEDEEAEPVEAVDDEPVDDEPDDDEPDDQEEPYDEEPEHDAGEDEEPPDRDETPPARPKKLGARAVARAAVEQVVEMTGKTPEGVTSVSRTEDGWTVGVEVVETERIPDSADVLAIYEAELDADAELMSYRRVRRYPRGRGDDE